MINFFNKQQGWPFIAIFLLMTNIATVATIWWQKGRWRNHENRKGHSERIKNYWTKKLDFSSEQEKRWAELDSLYNLKRETQAERISRQKKIFFQYLGSNVVEPGKLDSLMNEVSAASATYDQLRLEKAVQVHGLCDAKQKQKFSQLLLEMAEERGKNRHH